MEHNNRKKESNGAVIVRKSVRTFGLVVIALIITAALGRFSSVVFAEEPFVLKGVTPLPTGVPLPFTVDVPKFIDMVSKESNGRLKIEWVGGPEVIHAFDQVEALRKGTIDVLLYNPRGYFQSHLPSANAAGLSQLTAWEERKTGCYDLWVQVFREKCNAEYLGRLHSKIKLRVYTNYKVEKLDDFKGKKFRVMPLYVPMFKALGASPVTIPSTEVYTALERGVVDGYMWLELGVTSMKWHEITKFAIEPRIFQIEPTTVVNLDKFNKLPKDLQAVLKNSMEKMEYIATERVINTKVVQKEWEVMQKAGVRMIKLPPADAKRFVDIAYEATWAKVIKDDPVYGPKFKKLSSR